MQIWVGEIRAAENGGIRVALRDHRRGRFLGQAAAMQVRALEQRAQQRAIVELALVASHMQVSQLQWCELLHQIAIGFLRRVIADVVETHFRRDLDADAIAAASAAMAASTSRMKRAR